jgi:hypothetical protein
MWLYTGSACVSSCAEVQDAVVIWGMIRSNAFCIWENVRIGTCGAAISVETWLGTIRISNLKSKFIFSEIMGMSKFEVICIGHHQVMESI